MKSIIHLTVLMVLGIMVWMAFPVCAVEGPLFLLGQNETAEVVLATGEVTSLDLGIKPLPAITDFQGRKVFLCAGEEGSSGIKHGASLHILSQDYKAYEKEFFIDSPLTGYLVDEKSTVIWLFSKGGKGKKEPISPKIYRIDLQTFEVREVVLDSIPCVMELSNDEQWLAVATLGKEEAVTSALTLYKTDTMKPVTVFDVTKNPGLLCFNDDNSILLIAGYGCRAGFKIPTEYYIRLNQPIPAGIQIIDLSSLQSRDVELEAVNQEFIIGENETIYGIYSFNGDASKGENDSGQVTAVGTGGILWEQKCDYAPKYIQEMPEMNKVFIMGGKRLSIIQKDSGDIIKEIKAKSELQPFLFLDHSDYAYSYNMNKRRLQIMNANTFEIEQNLKAGSGGLALLKTVAVGLSFIDYYDSLQPRYVNGVRMPSRTARIYWAHAPKGNIVACPKENKLFMLNSFLAQIYTYDIEKGVVKKKMGGLGEKAMYLQMSPKGNYVILVSGDKWRLINTRTDKADLKFNPVGVKIRLAFQAVEATTPYFNPDGNRMYIPDGNKIVVIDLEKGKKADTLKSETKNPIVCW